MTRSTRAILSVLAVGLAVSSGITSDTPAGAGLPEIRRPSQSVVLGEWLWPLAGPHVVVRPYLAPATPWGPGHRGVDLESVSSSGAVIRAPADGVVHFAGTVVNRPVLSIAHPGGLISSFEPVTTTMNVGDQVTRGESVGSLEPGHCAIALCLHFGVRLGGEYVSPLLLLGGVPRAVLLPTDDG